MKKMKKFFAVILSLAMVLGMSMTAFATEPAQTPKAQITLNNMSDADKVEYLQIIQPNQRTATGWKFVSTDIASAFKTGLGDSTADDQAVIWGLIKYQYNATKADGAAEWNQPNGVTNVENITSETLNKAMSAVATGTSTKDLFTESTSKTSIGVNVAGIYVIKAEETNYVYQTMSAYVGFGEANNGKYPVLQNTSVTAKKTTTNVTKTTTDTDNAVAIGDIVTYTIEAYVPYIDASKNRTFTISDEIQGASYYLEGENSVATVKMGDANGSNLETVTGATIVSNANGSGFTVNLDSLVSDVANPNAGNKVIITYTAKITAVDAQNTAKGHISNIDYDGSTVDLYTGTITLNKVDAKNDTTTLDGAKFEVTKKNDSTVLRFKYDTTTKEYTYAPEDGDVTVIETSNGGKAVIKGLDKGTYTFTEVEAPEGYSKSNVTKDIELGNDVTDQNKATAIFTNEGTVTNTKLSSLPSTGGIGTTIFTIAGCAIMIAAAGFFFASRKKANR